MGRIEKAKEIAGTRWARPWKLLVWTGFAMVEAGRFATEGLARQAARRRGIRLPAPRPSVRQVRAFARLEVA